jgi:EmrB/QacA subfamily drug resistance transporter
MQHSQYRTKKEAALAVAMIMGFVSTFLMSSLNIALPTIGHEMHAEAVSLSWMATASTLLQAICMVPFGRVGDLFGRKRIYFIGAAILVVVCFMAPLSDNALLLIISMGGVGFAMGVNYGTVMAIVPAVYPLNERGKALGIVSASIYIGLSLGPLVGGFLTQSLGWRSIFIASGILGLAALLIAVFTLKDEWREAEGEKFDFKGVIIYAVALVSIMFGFSQLPIFQYFFVVLFGVIALGIFIWWENRQKHPVLDVSLFRNSIAFTFSNLAAFANYLSITGVVFMISLYLQYIKGFSPAMAGFILISNTVVMAILSPIAGRLSDRIESRIVSSLGMCFSAAGLIMLCFVDGSTSIVFIVALLVIIGLGSAFFISPNTNAVMSSVDKRYLGIASATLGTMRTLGQVLSMGIVMILFGLLIGRSEIHPENYPAFLQSFSIAFIIFSVLCVLGIFASLARGNIRK